MVRALPAGTPVLILDALTEHLDDQPAAALTRDLLAATGDHTVLLITHRTDDLAAVDEVIRHQGRTYGLHRGPVPCFTCLWTGVTRGTAHRHGPARRER